MDKPANLTFAFTGHRPKDLSDYTQEDLYRELNLLFEDRRPPARFITGGALGIDTWAAEYAIDHGIPLTLILPFTIPTMTKFWAKEDSERLHFHFTMAELTSIIHREGYHVSAYQRRNEAMVDHAHALLAFWTGKRFGGTYNCIRYALDIETPVARMLNRPPLRTPTRITTI